MTTIAAVTLNLALAASLANLPFLRLAIVRHWHPAVNDLLGWSAGYLLWIGGAVGLENAAGTPTDKNWEVWAITLALFAVLAFPGIVWRHLLQKA